MREDEKNRHAANLLAVPASGKESRAFDVWEGKWREGGCLRHQGRCVYTQREKE
jgi:hypothetical protein